MDRSVTEASFLADLERSGITMQSAQQLAGAALGITDIGTIETADTIIAGAWPTTLRGSMRYRCVVCNGFVSLSPSSQAELAEAAPRGLCELCHAGSEGAHLWDPRLSLKSRAHVPSAAMSWTRRRQYMRM